MVYEQFLTTVSLVFIIDHRTPGHIYVDGKPVPVQFLQYQLATLLAEHPGVCVCPTTQYIVNFGKARIVSSSQAKSTIK